jgi:Smg protein
MFDILVYVFENYLPDACPEPGALARKLSAVGFEEPEISSALDWLAGLDAVQAEAQFHRQPREGIHRLFHESELARLPAECRGYLASLEQVGAIGAVTREMIVERAMAVESAENNIVSLAKFKVIVLMVMWRRQLPLDHLVFENLLEDEDDDERPVMH